MCLGNNYKVNYISCPMYMTQRLTKGRKGYIFNYYFKLFLQDHTRATTFQNFQTVTYQGNQNTV